MYDYLGHPLVDVGIASLVHLAQRPAPQALRPHDLAACADWLAQSYWDGPLRQVGHGMAFLNPGYQTADPHKYQAYCQQVLYSWQTEPDLGQACAFCGRGAAYRANREQVPLLTGRDVYNFSAAGQAGLPICGYCSLALQALPLGCLKSSLANGGLLAAHSSTPSLLQGLTGQIVKRNLAAFSLAGQEKLPNYPYAGSRLVELLLDWLAHAAYQGGSVTGYFFNNGQSPTMQFLALADEVLGFLQAVLHHPDASLTEAWHRAIQRAWETPRPGAWQRNRLYEALFKAAHSPQGLLRRYLLPTRHWGLISLYMRTLSEMTPEKIALLRDLGRRLAVYVAHKRAFRFQFSRTQDYSQWRRELLRASEDHQQRTGQALISFDEFLLAFSAAPGEINDWRLSRDLVYLALLDELGADSDPLDDEFEFVTVEEA